MIKKVEHFFIIGILVYIFVDVWDIGRIIKIVIDASIPVLIGVFISFLMEPLINFFDKKENLMLEVRNN